MNSKMFRVGLLNKTRKMEPVNILNSLKLVGPWLMKYLPMKMKEIFRQTPE
jgi:hypothetical protein